MNLEKNKNKFKWLGIITIVIVLAIFLIIVATTNDPKAALGTVFLILGVNLIMPEPSADWGYFVLPVAYLIYKNTGPEISRNKAIVIAYGLSFVAGGIFLLIAVLLIGKSDVVNGIKDGFNLFTDPLTIYIMIVVVLVVIAILVYDFRLKRKNGKRKASTARRKTTKKKPTKRGKK